MRSNVVVVLHADVVTESGPRSVVGSPFTIAPGDELRLTTNEGVAFLVTIEEIVNGRPVHEEAPRVSRLRAFWCGVREFRSNWTQHYPDDGLAEAYDWGREWAHRVTLRRFEP